VAPPASPVASWLAPLVSWLAPDAAEAVPLESCETPPASPLAPDRSALDPAESCAAPLALWAMPPWIPLMPELAWLARAVPPFAAAASCAEIPAIAASLALTTAGSVDCIPALACASAAERDDTPLV
jgi:hypothetical protein